MAASGDKSFWNSLPGVLTGVAAVITAATGAWLALSRSGPDRPDVRQIAETPQKDDKQTERQEAVQPRYVVAADVLAASRGGSVVFASVPNWEKLIDGDEDQPAQISQRLGDYGIFAFRDRRRARISAFTITVPAAGGLNPAAIDLSYATQSEDGPFTPIGRFPVRNGRVPPEGRQVFRFDPVVARYLKVGLRESHSGGPYVMAYEIGAMGSLEAP